MVCSILEVGVGRDGSVHGIKVTRSALPFAEAVIATIKTWRFHPAGEAAAPVDSTLLVAAVFRPPQVYAPSVSTPIQDDGFGVEGRPLPLEIVTPPFPPRARMGGVELVEVPRRIARPRHRRESGAINALKFCCLGLVPARVAGDAGRPVCVEGQGDHPHVRAGSDFSRDALPLPRVPVSG